MRSEAVELKLGSGGTKGHTTRLSVLPCTHTHTHTLQISYLLEMRSDTASICWVTPQRAIAPRAGPGHSQELQRGLRTAPQHPSRDRALWGGGTYQCPGNLDFFKFLVNAMCDHTSLLTQGAEGPSLLPPWLRPGGDAGPTCPRLSLACFCRTASQSLRP